jgi:type IV pilus assembly protein PilY1
MKKIISTWFNKVAKISVFSAALWANAQAFTPSQVPPATNTVPGNLILALSVEFPTGLQVSYTSPTYLPATKYDGYFDNRKCYSYSTANEVFNPVSDLTALNACPVATQWAGNLLNWLTMTNVDQFRSVLTGGTRDSFSSMNGLFPGDTTARTVLIRSFSDRNSYNPQKNLTVGTAGMPLVGVNKVVRSGGYGSKFIVSDANNFANLTDVQQRATCAATPLPGATATSACFNIRVVACVATPLSGLEANCQNRYSGVAKPEGLVQEYSSTLRFGAFGYLNESNTDRNGGVLRSALKSVGSFAALATSTVANPAKEWDEITGIMFNNPDPTDAAASGVASSGLMNYLNKFGYAAGYKGFDPVSELYYAAQLYLRGQAPPINYSDNQTPALVDGFPVITGANLLAGGSRDPIINSCQKNFILGIGDIYAHCDGNLPGSTRGTCPGGTPVDPIGLNVQSLWDTTRGYEGLSDTGWVGGATARTAYVAGLAHWSNTNDIRTDLTGTQTISTYWVDVLENTNGQPSVAAASLVKSQYWLAAKYGGFRTELATSNDPNTNSLSWDSDGDGIPDTWFAGSTPTLLKAGLRRAFADIASRAGSGSSSSAAVSSTRQTSNSQIIYAGYDPQNWLGSLRGCLTSQTFEQCELTPVWEASRWFKTTSPTFVTTPLTPATRKIFTSSGTSTFTSSPFQWASLNTAQQTILNVSDSLGSARVDYLRGARTGEGSTFRARRDTLLGDIVNSGVAYLGGSGPRLNGSGTVLPGYSAYRATTSSRPPVAFVGANDGMLHAFSGTDGKELFGYIPGSVFAKLPGLTSTSFQHKFLVDSTPMLGDFQKSATAWGTMLVGGLGGGGKAYYALDISAQSTFSTASEVSLSTMPMWELTASQEVDLGFTYNSPSLDSVSGANLQIAKIADSAVSTGVWRVLVGNGYGSTAGKSALLMVNANTGVVANKVIADNGPNNGLSSPTPFDSDFDGLIDTIYAGDLAGNMHKFQFSVVSGTNFIRASSGTAAASWRYIGKIYASGQPITTAPSVAVSCDRANLIVAFGTGKMNEDPDYSNPAAQSFYSIVDKRPSSSLTVSSIDLAPIPFATTVVSGSPARSWTTPDLTGKSGWSMTFTGGERLLSNPTLPPDTGIVLFGTTKPSGNSCTPSSTGFVMAVNLCSGGCGDIVQGSVRTCGVGFATNGNLMISPTYRTTDGNQGLVLNQSPGTTVGTGPCSGALCALTTGAPRGRYSWRELLTK